MDIAQTLIANKEAEIQIRPQHTNTAYNCGHDCLRYLVLCRTRWEDRQKHNVTLQSIFSRGNAIEDYTIAELKKAGFKITDEQHYYTWKDIELTGHIDAMITIDGQKYPLEIKGLSPFYIDKLNSEADMRESDRVWVRQYPPQLQMYMLMSGKEHGIFILVNALTWIPKQITVDLDYDYADQIVKRLESVNQHVKDGTLPPGVDDMEICPDCAFFHICLPAIIQDSLTIEDDPQLAQDLARREELKEAHKEYEAIDKRIRPRLEGVERAIIGDYLVTGKWISRKAHQVAESQQWRKTIKRIPGLDD